MSDDRPRSAAGTPNPARRVPRAARGGRARDHRRPGGRRSRRHRDLLGAGGAFGYDLLWVLLFATIALVLFQSLAARLGAVTGQGLAGLVRQRYGARPALMALAALVVANAGTTAAEFAGIAAGFELFGVPRHASVPVAAVLVSALVLRGGFKGVERVLLGLSAVFACYIAAGFMARPDWGAAGRGLLVPTMPATNEALVLVAAAIGTTITPWGLAFVQSYVADKHLRARDLRNVRIDMVVGALLTGVIAFFVVVACAATLHEQGVRVQDAADAAAALAPFAGTLATELFAIGLIGAGLLAASILPLSTAYAVTDVTGSPAALNDPVRAAPLFYGTFAVVTVGGVVPVLIPGAPLVPILVTTQVVNAVLLLPILLFMVGLARDRALMGEFTVSRAAVGAYAVTAAVIAACVLALTASWLSG